MKTAAIRGPFVRPRRLTLDQRGENQHLLRVRQRQIGPPLVPGGLQRVRHRPLHAGEQGRGACRRSCRCRCQASARPREASVPVSPSRAGAACTSATICGAGQPFGDGQPMLDGLAAGDDGGRRERHLSRPGTRIHRPTATIRCPRRWPPISNGSACRITPFCASNAATAARPVCGGMTTVHLLRQRTRRGDVLVEPPAGSPGDREDRRDGEQRPAEQAKRATH